MRPPMMNGKSPADLLLEFAFSRNQNSADAVSSFSNTLPCAKMEIAYFAFWVPYKRSASLARISALLSRGVEQGGRVGYWETLGVANILDPLCQ